MEADALFSFYYRKLVKDDVLSVFKGGCYNLHGSMLPLYRGRAPVNWVLVNGETQTGVTLHHMTSKPDAGDIVAQQAIAIEPRDTAKTLMGKVHAAAGESWIPCSPRSSPERRLGHRRTSPKPRSIHAARPRMDESTGRCPVKVFTISFAP